MLLLLLVLLLSMLYLCCVCLTALLSEFSKAEMQLSTLLGEWDPDMLPSARHLISKLGHAVHMQQIFCLKRKHLPLSQQY